MTVTNATANKPTHRWTDGEHVYYEMCRQQYPSNGCVFSAGLIEGHPVDTMYLRWEKNGAEPNWLMLRSDEVSAILWVLSGAMWSHLMPEKGESDVPMGD